MYRAGIITVSDKGSQGQREDLSGPAIAQVLAGAGFTVSITIIVPDDIGQIANALIELSDRERLDLILTTGGTGLSPRDLTPEATLKVLDKEIPGMAEAMRYSGMMVTPHAMLSRAVAGVRGNSLIINLPGSPKGATENLAAIMPSLSHAISKIQGDQSDCAAPV